MLAEEDTNLLVLGDFNAIMDVKFDRSKSRTSSVVPHELQYVMDRFSIKDIWRCKMGSKRDYMFFLVAIRPTQKLT